MKKFSFLHLMYLFYCPSHLCQKALCCFWWFEFPLLRCGFNGMVSSHHGSCFWKGGWWRSSFVWAVVFQGTLRNEKWEIELSAVFQHGFQSTQLSECQNLGSLYNSVFDFSSPLIIYLFFLLSSISLQLRPLSFMLHISFINSFIFIFY